MGDNDGEQVILLNSWQSPFGARVKIALEEKGIRYKYTEEDLFNKSDLLVRVNPVHKKVPVLIHHGNAICESSVILEYIDEVWSPSMFLPSDPYQRAHARFWANFIDQKIYPNIRKIWMSNGEEAEIGKSELIGSLKTLEEELGGKAYFGGDTFGFVDIALIGFYTRFYTVEELGGFKLDIECPKFETWAQRCIARKSVVHSLPDPHKVFQFCLELKKKLLRVSVVHASVST